MEFLDAIAYLFPGYMIPGTCQSPSFFMDGCRHTKDDLAMAMPCLNSVDGFENVNRSSNLPCNRHPTCIYRNISLY